MLGTYYIKTNQAGPGAHICNCGYMVAADARGRGVATAMCKHSQTIAITERALSVTNLPFAAPSCSQYLLGQQRGEPAST